MALFLRGLVALFLAWSGAVRAFEVSHVGPVTIFVQELDGEGEPVDTDVVDYIYQYWDLSLGPSEFLSCTPADTYAVRWTERININSGGGMIRTMTVYLDDGESTWSIGPTVITGDFSSNCVWVRLGLEGAEGGWTYAWPMPPGGSPTDYDGDSIPDPLDPDDDNDGIPDVGDTQPKNPHVPGGGGGGGPGDPPVPPGGGGGGPTDPGTPDEPGPDDGPGGGGSGGRDSVATPAFGFGTLAGAWSSFSGIGATDYTLSFTLPLPGEDATYTFHSLPDTSNALGVALNNFRLLIRGFLTILVIWAFGRRVYRDLVNY